MGVARLLAKGWVVFCLFAGAHGLNLLLGRGVAPLEAIQSIGVCVLLFAAMGLLFVAGFGASYSARGMPFLARLRPHHIVPSFNDTVFLVFVVLIFAIQVLPVRLYVGAALIDPLQNTMYHVVPGQHALADALLACPFPRDRVFAETLASAFAWLLGAIYVASAVSRIGLTAGILRLERTLQPAAFGLTFLAALYGAVAIVAIQLLAVGSLYPWLGCLAFADIDGALLSGLAPLMLAYLIVAALATLRASGPEPGKD